MLVRFSAANKGIAQYLKEGKKQGRNLHRDELDERVVIDGHLDTTDQILKTYYKDDSQENYYHLTLSYSEKDISTDTITKTYEEYKKNLMAAFKDEEYNVYAEIHHPKIKSVTHFKTGEVVERLSHLHVVIPNINLKNGNRLKPVGKYTQNLKYIESLQEDINYKFNLSSSFDNPRPISVNNNQAKIIERYKADHFTDKSSQVKSSILDNIISQNITSHSSFYSYLVDNFSEVKPFQKDNETLYKIKANINDKRYIQLKDPVFKKSFIEKRIIERKKPSKIEVEKNLKDWRNKRSLEIKYIENNRLHRERYKAAKSFQEKQTYLEQCIYNYQKKYFPINDLKQHTQANIKPIIYKSKNKYNDSVIHSIYDEYAQKKSMQNDATNRQIQSIKRNLKADFLLDNLASSHSIVLSNYQVMPGNKIKVEKNTYNVSDFLTKHIHMKWNEAKKYLIESYDQQLQNKQNNREINSIIFVSERHQNKFYTDELRETETIVKYLQKKEIFEMRQQQQSPIKDLLKNQFASNNQESSNEENSIEGIELRLDKIKELLEYQEKLNQSLNLKASDLVAKKDNKKHTIEWMDKKTGQQVFKDHGDRFVFKNKNVSNSDVAVALEIAAEKFGVIDLKGHADFKDQCIEIAATKNLNVVFKDENLQKRFLEVKKTFELSKQSNIQEQNLKHQQANNPSQTKENNNTNKQGYEQPQSSNQGSDKVDQDVIKDTLNDVQQEPKQEGWEITRHGNAHYKFNKENENSYYISMKQDDVTKTIWGKNLEKTIHDNQLEIGDFVDINQKKKEKLVIQVKVMKDGKPVLDNQGNAKTEMKEVYRNIFECIKYENVSKKSVVQPNQEKVTNTAQEQEKVTNGVQEQEQQIINAKAEKKQQGAEILWHGKSHLNENPKAELTYCVKLYYPNSEKIKMVYGRELEKEIKNIEAKKGDYIAVSTKTDRVNVTNNGKTQEIQRKTFKIRKVEQLTSTKNATDVQIKAAETKQKQRKVTRKR